MKNKEWSNDKYIETMSKAYELLHFPKGIKCKEIREVLGGDFESVILKLEKIRTVAMITHDYLDSSHIGEPFHDEVNIFEVKNRLLITLETVDNLIEAASKELSEAIHKTWGISLKIDNYQPFPTLKPVKDVDEQENE